MSLDSDDDDDDDDVERLATYSSQGAAEPVDCRRDVGASSPTDDCRRGKQPATQSRVGANVAAKNRRRRTGVVTSSVTSESADDVDIALSQWRHLDIWTRLKFISSARPEISFWAEWFHELYLIFIDVMFYLFFLAA